MHHILGSRSIRSIGLVITLLLTLSSQSANAFSIKFVRDGSWEQMIFNPFTGDKIGSILVPHFKLQEIQIQLNSFKLSRIQLEMGTAGNDFLVDLGGGVLPITESGDQIAFDNTMIPGGAGFTSSTNGGSEFMVEFDSPFPELNAGDVIDLSSFDIFVSTPLDLDNSGLIQGSVYDGETSYDAELSAVPAPATILLVSFGLAGLIGTRTSMRFLESARKG